MTLSAGWNLISFNVVPEDSDLRTLLLPIAGLYTEVSTIEGETALVFRPERADELNTLQSIDVLHGYWIRLTDAATLTVQGPPADATAARFLDVGWNLISYLPNAPMSIGAALATLDNSYDEVRGFDVEAMSYFPDLPPQFSTLSVLEPGKGYLIHLTQPAVLFNLNEPLGS